jgi:anaphase-promoting complex subunit 10
MSQQDLYQGKKSISSFQQSCREIGDQATWTLSSCKQGNGVHQLRDDNLETFWQSDGPLPHTITLQFQQKTKVSFIALYLDYKTDESYTPQTVTIRGAVFPQYFQDIKTITLNNPQGWIVIPLQLKDNERVLEEFINTIHFQVVISAMLHQGKDTHVRLMKVFSPMLREEGKREGMLQGFQNNIR